MAMSTHMFLLISLVAAEVYSDLLVSEDFQRKALEKRHTHFWKAIDEAAEQGDIAAQVEGLVACAEDIPDSREGPIPAMLQESLRHLQNAAAGAGLLGQEAGKVAQKALRGGAEATEVRSPSDFFQKVYGMFVAGETYDYQQKLKAQVAERQQRVGKILKGALRGADVLTESRLASKTAFDVMKYDIYATTKVPKTSEEAKRIAERVVDLQAQVRKQYLGVITASALEIAADVTRSTAPTLPVTVPVEEEDRTNEDLVLRV